MGPKDEIRIILPKLVSYVLAAIVIGSVYGHFTTTAASPTDFHGLIRGGVTGALIGGVIGPLDTFLLQAPGAPLTRVPFLLNVAVRAIVYLGVFLFALVVGHWLVPDHPQTSVFSFQRLDILFCFAATFVVSFVFEVNRLLGQNVLLAFATGRYYRAKVEQRIFLIIDMKNSTAAAERLGEVGFHRLLNRLVVDLSGAIVLRKGEIYKYVGDEVIATWPLAEGVKDAYCLRACFAAIARLVDRASDYEREFGRRVEFRAGLHCGPVVVGELGSVKKEIALSGDTLNTAARIVDACRDTGEQVIASAALLNQLSLPTSIVARPLGLVPLRGKEQAVELFALETTTAF